MKKYLLLALGLIVGSTNFVVNGMIETSYPLLTGLLRDMNHYKIHHYKEYSLIETPGKKPRADLWFHRGDLFPHTMWVEQHLANGACLANVFNSINTPGWENKVTIEEQHALSINWCEGLPFVLSVAALLHDIGKAGNSLDYYNYYRKINDAHCEEYAIQANGDIPYVEKPDHEKIGMHYILHDIKDPDNYPAYHMVDGTPFNFKDLFNQLGRNPIEQKTIALLVGTHKIFAMLYNQDLEPSKRAFRKPLTLDEFNDQLNAIIREVGLEEDVNTDPDLRKALLQMIMALTMADLLGVYFEVFAGRPSPALQRFLPVPARRPFFESQTYTTQNGEVTVTWDEKKAHLDYCKLSFCAAAHWRDVLLGNAS